MARDRPCPYGGTSISLYCSAGACPPQSLRCLKQDFQDFQDEQDEQDNARSRPASPVGALCKRAGQMNRSGRRGLKPRLREERWQFSN